MIDEILKQVKTFAMSYHKVRYSNYSDWHIVKEKQTIKIYLDEITQQDFKYFTSIQRKSKCTLEIKMGIINNDEDCIIVSLGFSQ